MSYQYDVEKGWFGNLLEAISKIDWILVAIFLAVIGIPLGTLISILNKPKLTLNDSTSSYTECMKIVLNNKGSFSDVERMCGVLKDKRSG